jgi:hypothetical protein
VLLDDEDKFMPMNVDEDAGVMGGDRIGEPVRAFGKPY